MLVTEQRASYPLKFPKRHLSGWIIKLHVCWIIDLSQALKSKEKRKGSGRFKLCSLSSRESRHERGEDHKQKLEMGRVKRGLHTVNKLLHPQTSYNLGCLKTVSKYVSICNITFNNYSDEDRFTQSIQFIYTFN